MAKSLARRTMLKAAGVSLALPMLDAMQPAFAKADAAEPPKRFVGIMTNMGILPQYFFPEEDGRDYTPSPYLDILKDHRKDLTVFSGVSLPGVDGGHAAEKSFLTGAPGASRGSFKNSISLDQVMAEKVGGETRFPSLALMVGAEMMSCSWTRSGSMIPPQRSPLKLYQQLFVEDSAEGKASALRHLQEDRSLLDSLREKSSRLAKRVGAADRERLDQYYSSVRDLEQRLAKLTRWVDRPKPIIDTPAPEDVKDTHDLAKKRTSDVRPRATCPGNRFDAHHYGMPQHGYADAATYLRREVHVSRTDSSRQPRRKAQRTAADRRSSVCSTGRISQRHECRERKRGVAAR